MTASQVFFVLPLRFFSDARTRTLNRAVEYLPILTTNSHNTGSPEQVELICRESNGVNHMTYPLTIRTSLI